MKRIDFTIKNGNFISQDRASAVCKLLKTDGKWTLKEATTQRTLNQNAYLHSLFDRIAKDVGEEPDYIKYHFKSKFLKKYSIKKNIEYVGETSKLNTKEFGEFVDKVLNEMAKFGYTYPTPEQRKKGQDFNY